MKVGEEGAQGRKAEFVRNVDHAFAASGERAHPDQLDHLSLRRRPCRFRYSRIPSWKRHRQRLGRSRYHGRCVLSSIPAQLVSSRSPSQAYQRAQLVTSDELNLIKRVDRQPKAKTEGVLLTEGQKYAQLYLELLQKLNRTDTMQWILVLMTDALAGKPYWIMCLKVTLRCSLDHDERIPLFLKTSEKDPNLPFEPLLRCATAISCCICSSDQVLEHLRTQTTSCNSNQPSF